MRFFAQLLMTALFGASFTFLLIVAIPALTGWHGWYVFWPSFLVGMVGGTQLAYWLSGFIPEPPPPPPLYTVEWADEEVSDDVKVGVGQNKDDEQI